MFVPCFETRLTTPPLALPNWASKVLVMTLNSETASTLKLYVTCMLAEASSVVAPSSRMSPPPCCPPLSLKAPAGGEDGLLVMVPANPGESAANSSGLRISPPKGRGSDSSTWGDIVKPTSEDSDSRWDASLFTLTVADSAPTFNAAVTVDVPPTSTPMPLWV